MGLGTRGTEGPGEGECAHPPSPASGCPGSQDTACLTKGLRVRPPGAQVCVRHSKTFQTQVSQTFVTR